MQLIAIPEKCGRRNKYIINETPNTELQFSAKAKTFLKDLLSVKVPIFAVNGGKSSIKKEHLFPAFSKKELDEEKWSPIAEYPDHEVSTLGNIRKGAEQRKEMPMMSYGLIFRHLLPVQLHGLRQ